MTDPAQGPDPMKRTAIVAAKLAEVPPEKRVRMFWRTVIGLTFVAGGITAHKVWPGLSDYVTFALSFFGAVMASGQMMMHPMKLFVAFLRDIMDAWRGKSRDDTGRTIPPGGGPG